MAPRAAWHSSPHASDWAPHIGAAGAFPHLSAALRQGLGETGYIEGHRAGFLGRGLRRLFGVSDAFSVPFRAHV
jgi:hypothetical protein